MACCEHDCAECGHFWMDNKPRRACPLCGSTRVSTHFDEYPEENYDERDD